ncbi:hypothetical protein L2D08_15555 [Domibacillus sp. PGB-M46]|uniref:hypothetical protein n=1 Tax=Domibacillus sp. PGB-M46 TaxID=2910255 RepID=UPI001F59150D|nr:hypothetical protein [Domibacillus sp. PGB-M46]MCI2255782.1 hypothetical protein [Domibacillus sp. PGB-M46]
MVLWFEYPLKVVSKIVKKMRNKEKETIFGLGSEVKIKVTAKRSFQIFWTLLLAVLLRNATADYSTNNIIIF